MATPHISGIDVIEVRIRSVDGTVDCEDRITAGTDTYTQEIIIRNMS